MICIYQLNFSHGSYIGQTTNFQARLASHLKQHNCGPKLLQAWKTQKYLGYEILEECSLEELSQKEQYWIELRNPSLNMLPGGIALSGLNHPRNTLTKECIEEIVSVYSDTNKSYAEIAKIVNKDYQTVRDICLGKTHTWATEHIKDIIGYIPPPETVYSPNNVEYVIPYRKQSTFEKEHNLTPGTICSERNGWSKTKWDMYELTDPTGEVLVVTEYVLKELTKEAGLSTYSRSRLLNEKPTKGWATKKLS